MKINLVRGNGYFVFEGELLTWRIPIHNAMADSPELKNEIRDMMKENIDNFIDEIASVFEENNGED